MRRLNVLTTELEYDDADPPRYRAGSADIRKAIGAGTIAGRVYVLAPGVDVCPFHWETDEEWLLVLSGHPRVRHRDGEDVLEPGDVVAFAPGPDGVHQVGAGEDEEARIVMIATRIMPSVAVYPDSDKVGIWTEHQEGGRLYRQDSAVDYYDREPSTG